MTDQEWWDSLSDRELRSRLERQRFSEREARWLVQRRDSSEEARSEITEAVGR